MRKALVSLAGALGLAALYRAARRRRTSPAGDDPVDGLRAAIADSEGSEGDALPDSDDEPASPEERRRRVHERAQEAIDSMNDPPRDAA